MCISSLMCISRLLFRRLAPHIGGPVTDPLSCFAAGLEGIQEHALIFQRAPQTFDEDVVHPAATAVHRDADANVIQCVCEGEAGELAALVGVEDAGPAVASNRLLQRRNTEVSIHRVGEPPSEN